MKATKTEPASAVTGILNAVILDALTSGDSDSLSRIDEALVAAVTSSRVTLLVWPQNDCSPEVVGDVLIRADRLALHHGAVIGIVDPPSWIEKLISRLHLCRTLSTQRLGIDFGNVSVVALRSGDSVPPPQWPQRRWPNTSRLRRTDPAARRAPALGVGARSSEITSRP